MTALPPAFGCDLPVRRFLRCAVCVSRRVLPVAPEFGLRSLQALPPAELVGLAVTSVALIAWLVLAVRFGTRQSQQHRSQRPLADQLRWAMPSEFFSLF